MEIRLDYGRDGLTARVPDRNLEAVLSLQPQKAHYWPERGVRDALRQPRGCPPLAAFARGRQSACIVVCDITRPVPSKAVLGEMLAVLEAGGIPRDGITILVATGTHRPSTPAEQAQMLGPDIAQTYRIENHVATDSSTHTYLGETPGGVPIWVNSRFVEADLKISVGLIEPHFMAGYSGGRKMVCPGICGMETIKVWHGPRYIGHERSESTLLEGNPVHEDSAYIAAKAGLDFICDVTLDDQKKVTGIYAGRPESAWMQGVQAVEKVVKAPLSEPVDIVVTTTAGYPLDLTFYQAVKGMVGALPAVKEGGTIIIVARCEEGIGGPEFTETLLNTDDLEGFVQKTYEPGFFVPDQWEVHELAKALRKAEVLMYTEGIPAETLSRCFVTPISSVEEGIRQALAKHGDLARIAVIPKGPYVAPVISG